MSATIRGVGSQGVKSQKGKRPNWVREIYVHRSLLLLLIPGTVYLIIFQYLPIYGLTLGFKSFDVNQGILGSPWANPLLKHFNKLFLDPTAFIRVIKNTVRLAILTTVVGFLPR